MTQSPLEMLEEARVLAEAGQPLRALMTYRNLLLLHPESAEAWAEYGTLMLASGQAEGALVALSRSLTLLPDGLPALVGSGKACMHLGRWREAAAHFDQALAKDPDQDEVRLELARCLARAGDLDAARAAAAKVVERDPVNAAATRILIDILIRQEDWPSLHHEMLRRVTMDHHGVDLAWERSCVNLLFGIMPEGWDEHESRLVHPANTTPKRAVARPLWRGESIEGRTLLLHWEQGFGDTLMFVRYAAKAKRLGARVLLLAQPELADLVATCPGVDEVIVEGFPLPPFDVHLPLLSLPKLFRTDLASIPAEMPYLGVPPQVPNRAGIEACLAGSEGRTRIGISWVCSRSFEGAARKSILPELFQPLDALPEVAWLSLQYGVQEVPPLHDVGDLGSSLSNFSDTAYAVSRMDLVITIDTALAHLAGALGIPTLLLLTDIPDWRWLMGREDSPWYPSMRLYRQRDAKDWASVIQRVLKDLEGGRIAL